MGELNEKPDYAQASAAILESVAEYLYNNYETDPYPSRDMDAGIGDTEPWESAGKRKREYWFAEAEKMAKHFVTLLLEF